MAGLGADPWRRGAGKLFAAVTVLACVSWDLASEAQRPEEAAPMAGNLGAPAALVEGSGDGDDGRRQIWGWGIHSR